MGICIADAHTENAVTINHCHHFVMSQTIFQDAAGQAKAAFEVVEGLKKGEDAPAEKLVPFASITKDNVDQYAKK